MSLFKINLTPIIREREYEVQYVMSGRKEKTCSVCGKHIPVGKPAVTFLKRESKGFKTQYNPLYTCGLRQSPCAQRKAQELNVELP